MQFSLSGVHLNYQVEGSNFYQIIFVSNFNLMISSKTAVDISVKDITVHTVSSILSYLLLDLETNEGNYVCFHKQYVRGFQAFNQKQVFVLIGQSDASIINFKIGQPRYKVVLI